MRKVGKYEKMRKNALLSSYITSVLCLVLCVTMFFGTTAAWFTDTTTSQGNQIYVGKLEVKLNHASFKNGSLGNYEEVTGDYKVFKPIENGGIRWEPGYTAVEKFEIAEDENNDLAFGYQLDLECTFADTKDGETVVVSKEAKEAIAKEITVWNYVGTKAADTDTLPVSFAKLIEKDEKGKSDWEELGTLYEVIGRNDKPVFSGEIDKIAVAAQNDAKAYHMIALHMDENFDGIIKDAEGNVIDSAQGKFLDGITIKLVATQLPSEEDAFDSYYDATTYETVVVSDVSNAAGAFDMNKDTAVYLPAGETNVPAIALHGTGESESDYLLIGKNTTFANDVTISSHSNLKLSDDAVLTIDGITVNGTLKVASYHKNIVIKNVKAKSIVVNDNGNVTIENCQIDGSAGNGIELAGTTDGYNVTIRNNTIKNTAKNSIQIFACPAGTNYAGGKIVVEGNSFDTWCQLNDEPRAAFKIWGDAVYAPEDITASKAINDAAKELISSIGANNTFNATNMNRVKFDIYGYTFDALN